MENNNLLVCVFVHVGEESAAFLIRGEVEVGV